ncbi:hypothetical protein CMV_024851 [Castanea mollissima]|uniref:Uncharacterized protein n=1 Tax=Castanea mollissima TaxID=60419 RepID=A0A8J4V973_9ROSI|nr:hypothetical protein CMV_024851 [Castanea mollissima]
MSNLGDELQDNSQFVMMLERGNMKQRDQLFDIIRSERSVTDTAMNRDPDAHILKACTIEEVNAYHVDATGASVTADSKLPEKNIIVKSKESASGAGTIQRKELNGTTCIRALSKTWGEKTKLDVEVVNNTSAESPFDGNIDNASSKYMTFSEYFNKKYGITLMHPGQPLCG